MIIKHIEPDVTKTWEEFCRGPCYSIAVDGYVKGPAQMASGPYVSFDHHSGGGVEINRFNYPSASAQIYINREDLFKRFSVEGRFFAHVYLNHGDQDSCLSLWQLENLDQVLRDDGRLRRLVEVEDLIDRMAGVCKLDFNDPLVRQQAWIFQPYSDLRMQGKTYHMSGERLTALLMEVGERITAYAGGRAEQIDLDNRYEMLQQGKTWGLIQEIGPYARCNLLFNGITTIANTRTLEDGRHIHTIIDRSGIDDHMLEEMRGLFNFLEGLSPTSIFSWGGAKGMLSSPLVGSNLPWQVVAEEIARYRE